MAPPLPPPPPPPLPVQPWTRRKSLLVTSVPTSGSIAAPLMLLLQCGIAAPPMLLLQCGVCGHGLPAFNARHAPRQQPRQESPSGLPPLQHLPARLG